MSKFRKKPVVIDAEQWFKNGDHSEDDCEMFDAGDGPFQGEGKIVRYFRRPNVEGQTVCVYCDQIMHIHGWIDTPEGYIVCPGDWIIKGSEGRFYPCEDDIFKATYDPVDD